MTFFLLSTSNPCHSISISFHITCEVDLQGVNNARDNGTRPGVIGTLVQTT
jgi:hypothetical protein